MADKRELYKDKTGQRYAVPAQPSLDTQQKVAIPDYRIQQTYGGSHVNRDNPNMVFFDEREANAFNANKNQILAHEMQHQIEGMTRKKGQAASFAVDDAWMANAKSMNKDPRYFYEMLQNNLVKPQVQKRLQELGAVEANRVSDKPKNTSLKELLADLSSFETVNRKDLTQDSVLKKHLFNDDTLRKLYKSTTGMSGVVIGDSDYTPYSLEASEAWYGREPSGLERLKGMVGYQKGGLAFAAQHLESKGRGQDKKLVHVSPRELQGLQALAKAKGGSLTVNPQTGLPEAGFLEDILPMLAMGAATYFTAGAATPMLMSAGLGSTSAGILAGAGAGALIGGGSAALTGGDVGKSALTGGIGGALSGALGAYGGGAEPVTGTGINPNAGVSSGVGVDPNAGLAQSTQVGTQALNLNPQTGSVIDPLAGFQPPTGGGNVPASYGVSSTTPVQATTYGARDTAGSILNAQPQTYSMAPPAPAAPAAPVTPDATANKGWWDSMSPTGKAATAVGGAALLSSMTGPKVPTYEEEESTLRRISPNFRAQEPIRPNPYYRPVYAAGGGGISDLMMSQGGAYSDEPLSDDYGMASGGLSSLGGYSDGGRMLKGPGDGMSDSIPANIGGKQPARLADGEFVVPADVVSHLGNGSTDAGAKKLYAMMDKVRQARTGRKKQAPAINPNKAMPV